VARIRTIKPEFWSSPANEGMSPWARLLFVAMWNWADDHGRGPANPGELAGFAFPNDAFTAADIRRMLGEVRRGFGVDFYKVAGRPFYSIPSWQKHQKIDKRSGEKYPRAETGEPWDPEEGTTPEQPKQSSSAEPAEGSAEPAESPPQLRRDPGAGTGEQGNRGREGSPTSGRSLGAQTSRARAEEISGTAHSPRAHKLINTFASACNKRPPTDVLAKLGPIVDRLLAQDFTDDHIRAGLTEWNRKGLGTHLVAEVVNEVVNSDRGRHLRAVDDIPDSELTREFLDKELGPDTRSPETAPRQIEEGDPAARRAWYQAARERRLTERRAEWRRRRSAQDRTSA
jgi:hypothetical protein